MPGGKPEASPTASPPPEPATESGSVLKPIQNKIRNLRKAIDRATPLEAAAARGEELNPDQQECVRSKAVKVALLSDLEELLKKQIAIVGTPEEAGTKTTSKRAAKRKEKEAKAAAAAAAAAASTAAPTAAVADVDAVSGSVSGGAQDGVDSTSDEHKASATEQKSLNAHDKDLSTGESSEALPRNELTGLPVGPNETGSGNFSSPESVAAAVDAAESAAVSKVLDLLHVADFLQTQEGKGSLLEYFARYAATSATSLTALDMDILLYFATMLTTPNGNVAHPRAVDTSTAHCVAYLRKADAEAFQGTTYGRLAEIVDAISSCPLLARRGEPLGQASVPFGSAGLVAEDSAISSIGPVSENDWKPQQAEFGNGMSGGGRQGSNASRGRRGGGKNRGRAGDMRGSQS